jgi:hypothetical protein
MSKKETIGGSLGLGGILTIIFVVLKCFNVIDWPWWNFNPFAGSVLIILVWDFWILVGVLTMLAAYFLAKKSGNKP